MIDQIDRNDRQPWHLMEWMGDTGAKRSDLFPRPACAFRINYERFVSPELSEHALNRVVLRGDPAARDGQDIEKGMRKPGDEPIALEIIGGRDGPDLAQSPERKEAQERNRIKMARMIGERREESDREAEQSGAAH